MEIFKIWNDKILSFESWITASMNIYLETIIPVIIRSSAVTVTYQFPEIINSYR